MDWMVWSMFWVAGALVSFTVLLLGICRARGFAETSRAQQGNGPGQHAAGVTASAPLEEFGEELLAQKLARLHSQQSFYDRVVDWTGQRFTFWQAKVLVSSWRRFFTNVTEAAGTQNDFVRRTAERATIPLEAEKTQSTLRADREEQRLREAKAEQERTELGKEARAPSAESSQDPFKKKTEEFARRMQSIDEIQAEKIRERVGEKSETQWTPEDREYVERVKNFCDRERERLMERV